MKRFIAPTVILLALAACGDPSARDPEAPTASIRAWAQKLAAASDAETLDVRIEQSRAAAQRLASIPGASNEQQNAASLLAARGFVQSATFGLSAIDAVLEQDRIARAGIASTVPDMVVAGAALEALAAADLRGVADELEGLAGALAVGGVGEGINAGALAEQSDELKSVAATMQSTAEARLAEARERIEAARGSAPAARVSASDDALALTLEGRDAARQGMIAQVTHEALAIIATHLAAVANADEHLATSIDHAARAVAEEAKRLTAAAQANSDALEAMTAAVTESAKGMTARRGEALTAMVESVTQDLASAATAAGRASGTQGPTGQSARNEQLTIALLQARLADARATAALSDAALADLLAKAGDVTDGIDVPGEDPTELVTAAVNAFKLAKEAIDGSSQPDPTKEFMKAQIDRAIQSLEAPEDFVAALSGRAAASTAAADAPKTPRAPRKARAAAPAGPALPEPVGFESPDALLEALKAGFDSTEACDRFVQCFSGTNPETRHSGQVLSRLVWAMSPMAVAAKVAWGAEGLTAMGDVGGGAMGSTDAALADVTETTATVNVGGQSLALFKDGDAWYFDAASVPGDALNSPQMKQLAPQLGLLLAPMRSAAEGIAVKITAGEFTDPQAAMTAFQQSIMAAMMKAAGNALGGMAPSGDEPTNTPPDGAEPSSDEPSSDEPNSDEPSSDQPSGG